MGFMMEDIYIYIDISWGLGSEQSLQNGDFETLIISSRSKSLKQVE